MRGSAGLDSRYVSRLYDNYAMSITSPMAVHIRAALAPVSDSILASSVHTSLLSIIRVIHFCRISHVFYIHTTSSLCFSCHVIMAMLYLLIKDPFGATMP